jgi:hypothetical protein
MTIAELEERLLALEKAVKNLQARPAAEASKPWWIRTAGRFANDPVFDEIVRLGREYRQSLRPQDDEDDGE